MLRANRYLCLDIGASTMKLAQFHVSKNGMLTLDRFNFAEISIDPARQEHHSPVTSEVIRELLKETGVKHAPVMLSVPGQSVFTRFVKLPAVEETKVVQIIQYEAQQNVPFPMEEVVWDYQLIGGGAEEELEVVLVAIKSEIIEEMTDAVIGANLSLNVVDVAPMALYNAVRYNYPEWFSPDAKNKECVMVLDIGARTSNLVFVEGNRIFSRSISVAGNSITQAIASELNIPFREAEKLKRQKGIVGLGGAYEEPSDETQAHLGKITRNVITQLHADVNRTINFYRTQRGGSAPTRMLLSGGASIMVYLDRFFHESLHLPVEFFNPFRNVEIAPSVSREQLSQCAHFFGEVVGVALRGAMDCPIQVSLLPRKILEARAALRRIPYFAGAGACVLVTLLCWAFYYDQVATQHDDAAGQLQIKVKTYNSSLEDVRKKQLQVREEEKRLEHLAHLVDVRSSWLRVYSELNEAIADDSLWIIDIKPKQGDTAPPPPPPSRSGQAPPPPAAAQGTPGVVELEIRGLGLADLMIPGNNIKKAQDFVERLAGKSTAPAPAVPGGAGDAELKEHSMFDVDKNSLTVVRPDSGVRDDYERNIFRFSVTVKLKKPISP